MDNVEPVLPGEYDGITAAEVPEPEESATYHWVEDSTKPPPSRAAAAGEKYRVSVVPGPSPHLQPSDNYRRLHSDPNRAGVFTARKAVLMHGASAERAASAESAASADRAAAATINTQSSQQSAKVIYSKVESQDGQMSLVESVIKRDPQQPTREVAPGVFV